jgi:FixJ family two-component response regulator/DNA-binding MarR family transcriptional regulator
VQPSSDVSFRCRCCSSLCRIGTWRKQEWFHPETICCPCETESGDDWCHLDSLWFVFVIHRTARIRRKSAKAIVVPARSPALAASNILDAGILLVAEAPDVPWDVLSSHGYRVQRAVSASQAHELFSHDAVSVVIVDIDLMGAESFALIEALRDRARAAGWTEFLLVCGGDAAAAARHAVKHQVSDLLLKPLGGEQLIEAVSDAYNVARMQRFKQEETRSLEASLVEFKTLTHTAISRLIARVQDTFDVPSAHQSPADVPGDVPFLQFVEDERRRARLREKVFEGLVLGSSGWALLLVLAESHLAGTGLTIKSAAYAAGLPLSSALRKLNDMCAGGLVDRREDPRDTRRSFVTLTPQGLAHLARYFSQVSAPSNTVR